MADLNIIGIAAHWFANPHERENIAMAQELDTFIMEMRAFTDLSEENAHWLRLLINEAAAQKAGTSLLSPREALDLFCDQVRDLAMNGAGRLDELIARYKATLPQELGDGS